MPTLVRPPWDRIVTETAGANVGCSCGTIIQTQFQLRRHWQLGHFDFVEPQPSHEVWLEAIAVDVDDPETATLAAQLLARLAEKEKEVIDGSEAPIL